MKLINTLKQKPKLTMLLLLIPSIIVLVMTIFLIGKAYNNAEVMQLSLPFKDAHAETEQNDMELIKNKKHELEDITNGSVNSDVFDLSNLFKETSNDHQITKDVYGELKSTYYLSLEKAMNATNKNNFDGATPESIRDDNEIKYLDSLRKINFYGEDVKEGFNHNSEVKEIAKEERLPEYESLKDSDISNSQMKGKKREDEIAQTGFRPYSDKEELDNQEFEE